MRDVSGTVRIAILANGAKARQEMRSVGKEGSKLGGLLKTGIGAGAVAAGAGLTAAFVGGVKAAEGYLTMQRKTAAVIKSTGNAARISVKGVKNLAGQLESMSGIDEDLIINSQNLLATFTNVRNGVKKSDKVFDQATTTIVDMSAALGTDLKASTIQVGKALNDPIKGITALSKVGVSFTQGQKDQIKALVESGRTMDAQKIILAELNKEFGGAAKAAGGEGFTGALNRAKDSVGDFFRDLTIDLLPTLTKVTDWFTQTAFPAFTGFADTIKTKVIPQIRDALKEIGKRLPKIDIKDLFGDLARQARDFAQPVIDGFTTGIRTGNWGPFGTALGTALGDALGGFANLAGDVAGAIGKWAASVDWLQVGKKVGAQALPFVIGFGNSLFDPLTSKEFWSKNWDEVILFAIAFIPYGKGGTSIASRIGSKLGLDKGITGAIIGGLEGSVGRIGRAVIDFVLFVGRKFLEGFRAAFPTIGKGLDDVFVGIGARFLYAGDAVKKVIPQFVGDVFTLLGRTFGDSVKALGGLGARIIGGIVRGMFGAIRSFTLPYRQGATLIAQDVAATAIRALGWGRRIFGGLVRGAVGAVRTILTPFRQGAQLAVESVVRLGGRLYTSGAAAVGRLRAGIASRVGRFRDVLFDAGVNVMQGFLSGISSFYNSHVKPYLNWITSRLPFEKGPAARDKKILFKSGTLVMGGFQSGLESQYRDVRSSLGSFTSSLGTTGLSGSTSAASALATSTPVAVPAGTSAPTTVILTLDLTGDPILDAIITGLRKGIKVRGGNVQTVLGRG